MLVFLLLAQSLLDEATAHYRAGRPAEAVRLYEQYLANHPDRADVRFFLGAAQLNLNRNAEALENARRALELDSSYGRAWSLAGRSYTAQEQWTLAEQAFRKALEYDARDRDTWYFLGRCLYEANRFESAVEAFQRALILGAELSRTYENLGLALDALVQYDAAEKAYRRAVELAGHEYRPWFAYGVFLQKQGRFQEALPIHEKAAERGPRAAEVHFELGKVLMHLERFAYAERATEAALALSNECRFRLQLSRIRLRQGKREEVKPCETR